MPDIEQRDDALEFLGVFLGLARPAAHAPAIVEVLPHAEMREQPALLEYVADAASMRRHVDAAGSVEQHRPVDGDGAAIGREQAGDHIHDRRLSRARRPEQRRHAARRIEAHGKFQRAKLLLHVDGEHDHSPWKRTVARRASHSEANSAANANTIAIKTSRPAAASPPGTWVKV